MMIEIFKTNVTEPNDALLLIERIHNVFSGYSANFDLNDCDHILRIQSTIGAVKADSVMALLNDWGFVARVLTDEVSHSEINILIDLAMINQHGK
jgi:hypothetical protein